MIGCTEGTNENPYVDGVVSHSLFVVETKRQRERVYLLVIIVRFSNMGINWQQMCNNNLGRHNIVTLTEINTGLIFTLYIQDLMPQGWIIHIHL